MSAATLDRRIKSGDDKLGAKRPPLPTLAFSARLTDAERNRRNTRPAGESVQFALTWFMNSRPHRANILHPHHNRIGVGIVEGPPGWYTYVLVFAQR